MTKQVKWVLAGIIALIIAGMIAYPSLKQKFSSDKPDGRPAVGASSPMRSATLAIDGIVLKKKTLTDKVVSTGITIPDEEVNLSFESSGKIVGVYFTEGTHVKKGELLAKINDKPLQAELKKLEAQIQLAKDRVFRQGTLLKKDAVSQEAYEQVTTEYEKLMADIELVKAHIMQTELLAPFDGIIGLRLVSEGAYATPATEVANLTKISPLKIEFSINERYAEDVAPGTNITFLMESTSGQFQEHHAKVYAVESKVTLDTRTLKVRALYPNANEAILPGRTLSIEITRREILDALVVPSEAIIPEMGRSIVYVYRDGQAKSAVLTTGLRSESEVQAIEGVQEGDTVITTGVMQMRQGMKVIISNLRED
ncbi:MAG: efflux RND transporter periplasmic adaptor subunit [Tannerella sp.]|jgi:membrane fusion protein (multidrug efflux system)|nr:efflux RND transporter periplasmic adaptor subunit [Tannerella sp.]